MSDRGGATRIILLRHGRTGHNAAGRWQGQIDIDLDDVGRAQAQASADVLAAELTGTPVVMVASDLRRAWDTGQVLAGRLGVEQVADKRLREVDAGSWEGLTRAQIVEQGMGDQLRAWAEGEDVRVGGGERRSEVGARGAAAVQEHADAAPDGSTLVVTAHGGCIRGTVLTLLGLPPGQWDLLAAPGNAQWCRLVAGRAITWRLAAYGLGPA